MKESILVLLVIFSFKAFACPNISGSFKDEDDQVVTIIQSGCEQLQWSDSNGEALLVADNKERVVEKEGDNIAYGKARFTATDFVLDLRVVYANGNPNKFPTHFLTSYRIDKFNNMVEKIESKQGTSLVTFRRIK